MFISYTEFSSRVAIALLCGAVVGAERQWRQRMAGLRTNALVSMRLLSQDRSQKRANGNFSCASDFWSAKLADQPS